jgi:predicted tellurium resistance membrane protein TerC
VFTTTTFIDMPDFPNLADPALLLSLLTLTFLEIVLGVDNIIFISIVAGKLPPEEQPRARNIGLLLALCFRIGLLFTITWMMRLTTPVFSIPFLKEANGLPLAITWKDLILIIGGIFLLYKSTVEIHHKLEKSAKPKKKNVYAGFGMVLFQIVLVDAVFSVDSILTAIGLVENVWVMIIAVVISMGVMLAFAGAISRFISKHPTLQILALAFLIAIGIILIAQGFHQKISKSYLYTAIAFSLVVEMINIRLRKNREMVELNDGEL